MKIKRYRYILLKPFLHVISVVIPALNEEKTIETCLLSLKNQTYDNFEIIVVDGGSEDSTVEIAHRYARVIMQKSSTIGGARREGAEAASGDLLAFTDADSVADCNWLMRIAENLDKHELSYGPVYFYENNFGATMVQFWRRIGTMDRFFGFYRILGPNVAIRKNAYLRVKHDDISLLEDFDFSMRISRENIRAKYDRNQIVYTSARRLKRLLPYLWLYMYGHYHYLAKNRRKLEEYPRVKE